MGIEQYYKSEHAMLYKGDNLELLKLLPEQHIDLIYCDILYNTGKKFKDYDDNLGSPMEAMDWYRPRIVEMKRVLKESGSIYLQCDCRLVHYLKVEMDSVFGLDNFKNDIIWCYKSPSGTVKNKYANKHDNILFYTKSSKYIFNVDDVREKYAENTIKQAENKNISFGRETKLNSKGKTPTDTWEIPVLNSMAKERVGYDTQKPKELIDKIIKASSNENDIVADFFMGSGTTGEVAIELGRKFIGCDISEKACQITKERISKLQ